MIDDSSLLLSAASQGDPVAIESLYVRHLPAFRAYVRLRMGGVLRGKETESDIVQSVFRDVVEELDDLKWQGEAAFKHFLYEKGRRKIIDHARHFRAKRRDAGKEVAEDSDLPSIEECHKSLGTPSQFAMGHERLEELEVAFQELEEDHAEVILCCRVLKLSNAETAKRMERSEGAVRVLLFRALAKLAIILKP